MPYAGRVCKPCEYAKIILSGNKSWEREVLR